MQCLEWELEIMNPPHPDSVKQPPFFRKQAHKLLPAKQKASSGPWLAFRLAVNRPPL
jgi:hypothetical protein